MKRFVIILLALLSGLTVPQAVAVAAGRAPSGVEAAQLTARPAMPAEQAISARAPTTFGRSAPRQAQPLAAGLSAPWPTVHIGDRARE